MRIGERKLEEPDSTLDSTQVGTQAITKEYVGNLNSRKFHYADCKAVGDMSVKNRIQFNTREGAIKQGYSPCRMCLP